MKLIKGTETIIIEGTKVTRIIEDKTCKFYKSRIKDIIKDLKWKRVEDYVDWLKELNYMEV